MKHRNESGDLLQPLKAHSGELLTGWPEDLNSAITPWCNRGWQKAIICDDGRTRKTRLCGGSSKSDPE